MSHIKRSPSRICFDILNITLMLLIAFACLAPVWHVIMASFSDPVALNAHTGLIVRPLGEMTLEGYRMIFAAASGIIIGYRNTILYVITGVTFGTTLTILAGYVLSRKYLYWRNLIMFFLALTMLFSGGLIPFFMVVRALGFVNTPFAVVIPGSVSVFNIIIMRTAFANLPESLEESAKIDGAGQLTIMFKIMVPLAKATIAVVVLFYSITMWNSWFNASIFLTDRNLFPLQLFLREVLIQDDIAAVATAAEALEQVALYRSLVQYSSIVAATLPVLFFYPFAQKHFVTGVMIGSIKG